MSYWHSPEAPLSHCFAWLGLTISVGCSTHRHPCLRLPASPKLAPKLPLQVRQLKQLLEERGISYADLNEKGGMVDRILDRCARVTYYR
jgi:hypothetical protein